MLIFGGATANGEDGALWSYRNNIWIILSSSGPEAREDTLLIYHRVNRKSYLMGGRSFSSNSNFADFWEWDGNEWSEIGDNNPFGYRAHMCACYDETNNRIVLFGGLKGNELSNELWTWNENGWSQITQSGDWPSGRLAASLVYSPASGNVFLFGGSLTNGTIITDVWELDGTSWKKLNENFPSIGNGAYHVAPYGQNFVMIGGFKENRQPSSEQWNYNPIENEWTSAVVTHPSPRVLQSLVSDPTDNKLLMFGGGSAGSLFNELWQHQDNEWNQIQ